MAVKKEFKVSGDKARCSSGTMTNSIETTPGHGVLYNGIPLLNANDHFPFLNVKDFGNCIIKTTAAQGVPQKCIPATPLSWQLGEEKHCIEGAPALTKTSTLTCSCGGIIKFIK